MLCQRNVYAYKRQDDQDSKFCESAFYHLPRPIKHFFIIFPNTKQETGSAVSCFMIYSTPLIASIISNFRIRRPIKKLVVNEATIVIIEAMIMLTTEILG